MKEPAAGQSRQETDPMKRLYALNTKGSNLLKSSDKRNLTRWKMAVQRTIEDLFGKDSHYLAKFNEIEYEWTVPLGEFSDPEEEAKRQLEEGVKNAQALILSMIDEIRERGLPVTSPASNTALDVNRLLERFHTVARQLEKRRTGRSTLFIRDEYDVQDLLHSLLKLVTDDIRPEEYVPSYAGGCSRMDFLLKTEKIVIETKMARDGLDAKKLGEELTVDIARYKGHPDCKELVCFVYDPRALISNPAELENDLGRKHDGLPVMVLVRPKS